MTPVPEAVNIAMRCTAWKAQRKKFQQHDPESPLLIGDLRGDEVVTDKEMHSLRDNQISLFDLPEMI